MRAIEINYELDDFEIHEIVVCELKDAYLTLLDRDLDENEKGYADKAKKRANHILEVLKYYMDKNDYETFMKELSYENN